jgi:nucleoside-diphosphate-sugar epimerase
VTKTVVVFGARSWVGGYVVRSLLGEGNRVVAVTRRPDAGRLLLPEESERFTVVTADAAASALGNDQVSAVNLAYVQTWLPERHYRDNRSLARSIGEVLTGRCERLVHISTAAVFGYGFEDARPARVRWRPAGELYIESKVMDEHLMERLAKRLGCELAIVRLGNVIGPDSPLWVADLAQRVMELRPMVFEDAPCFSNATHAENVADYVSHVLREPAGTIDDFGAYHHLAEFSGHRWPELLDVISDVVGHRWTAIRRPPPPPAKSALPKRIAKAAYRTSAGGYLRPALALLPPRIVDPVVGRIRDTMPLDVGPAEEIGQQDAAMLEILSAAHEFRSWTLPGWKPRLDFATACSGISEWLRASGYDLRDA